MLLNEPEKIQLYDVLGNVVEELQEVWFDVKDYEGFYKVSSIGRVKSVERYVKHSKGGLQILRSRIMKTHKCKSGYVTVNLSKNGKNKTKTIHSILCESVLKRPIGAVIDHLDGDKSNNNIDNLRYCSQRENLNNLKSKSKTGHTGVFLNPKNYNKRFRSRIKVNGKMKDLGSYHTAKEAHQAYLNEKNKLNTIKWEKITSLQLHKN